MRWHIDLIHIIGTLLAIIGLWTVAITVMVAWESRKEKRK